MTVKELIDECERSSNQDLKSVIVRVDRHSGTRIQIVKGLIGKVIGSDSKGSFVSFDICKIKTKMKDMNPDDEIPKTSIHRAKVGHF